MSETSLEGLTSAGMERSPSFREVLARYPRRSLPFTVYALVRMAASPYEALARLVPRTGRLLDVGCGFGLWLNYLAFRSPGLRLEGIDPDPRKVSVAAAAGGGSAEVHLQEADGFPDRQYDVVTVVDVLYLIDPDGKRRFLRSCIDALSPGGLLLLKDVDVRPRWKFRLTVLEETVAVRIVNLTRGDRLHFWPASGYAELLRSEGLVDVAVRPMHKGYPHPHVLISGRRSMSGAADE